MGEIPTGAIPSQKATREVGVRRQNILLLVEELENVVSVVELSRIAVLRRQAIVHRHHHGGELAREAPANIIVGLGIGAEKDESAAVEEDDDGEGIGIGIGRDEKAEPEVARGVDGDVGGFDAVAGFGGGRHPQTPQ